MDADGPREDINADGDVFPFFVRTAAIDAEVKTVVVFAIEVFLWRVVLYLVGITGQGQIIAEVDVHNFMACLMIADDEAWIVTAVAVVDQSEEREVVVSISLSNGGAGRGLRLLNVGLSGPRCERMIFNAATSCWLVVIPQLLALVNDRDIISFMPIV